ncbi:Tyrosine-protein kinase STYK1 [Bagarius yarrelli]|uniref:Tyrosine-protein kinase STYK1 n=1 Tax=Bagarius yarrelli TaxID=175774 RepID=A0A556U8M1_BAGYA|nr:Tyrosine-protein kinase STYK1 [Bagarius yarrelli]
MGIGYLRLCHKVESYLRQDYSKKRQDLQGIDAPPELNPLDHEVVPMRVQTPNYMTNKHPAVTQASIRRQHCSFEHIAPLSLSFTVRPDSTVTLYQATLDQKPVVLRVLNESADFRKQQIFLGFAHFLSNLGPHPCLPTLLGVARDSNPLFIVLEWLENQDLLGFLWRCRKVYTGLATQCAITERTLFSMARQIASALEHLHSKNCIHGNISTRSVLVGQDLSVKLWGLGPAFHRSMKLGTSGEEKEIELRKWQAPEVLAGRSVSQSSDIYYIIKACCQWKPQNRASLTEVISMLQLAESSASETVTLQTQKPLNIEKYMQEAGYGEAYLQDNFAIV